MAGLNRRGPLRGIALLLSGVLLAGVLSGVLACLPLLSPAAKAQDQPEELRGVWLTANDMPVLRDRSRMQAAVDQLAELGFNRLYPVVWNGGFAYYPSRVSEARQLQDFSFRGLQGQDILAELISAGRNRGLKVIPWFEFGFMAPPESPLAQRHRSWLTQTRDGGLTSTSAAGRVVWLNPFRPEVQQLITDLVLEVVNDWGADGIQFDDHMSLPREFGYDPFTRALYRKDTGKDPPANPQGSTGQPRGSGLGEVARRPDHRLPRPADPGGAGRPPRRPDLDLPQLLRLRLQAAAAGLARMGAARHRR